MSNLWYALGLTLLAGLATGIGSTIAFFARRTNYRLLSVATGFSAGVMLYVSFVEILPKGFDALAQAWGERLGHWVNTGSFFGGMLLIGLIDTLVPAAKNPHETHPEEETAPLHDTLAPWPDFTAVVPLYQNRKPGTPDHRIDRHRLVRMGLFTALAIAIHNFPEGLATFLAALQDHRVGGAIAVAVALHNIPEGISVSVPIYYATGDRRKAFGYSILSGMAEPVGAGVAYLAIRLFMGGNGEVIPPQLMGLTFGAVAGIMVYISLDELLPTSKAYGKGHDSLLGLLSGMVLMALSLLMMK